MANADVVIDKNVWTGDDLTVAADGTVTVSTGKEVSIKKSLLPGKYKLQGTVVENAKIVAVYGGHEYALGTEFEIAGENAADVTVKVTAVTANTQFSFSGVKFELIFDFAAAVSDLETQLSEIVTKGDNSNLQSDPRWNNENGDLKYKSTELAAKIKAIKNGDYKVYGDNQLWKGADSPALKALSDEIASFGDNLDEAVKNVDAYLDAQTAYNAALGAYTALEGTEWNAASEYTKGLYKADLEKIKADIDAFKTNYEKAYKDGTATTIDVAAFTTSVNSAIATLKTKIAKADADNVSWVNIKTAYDDAQQKFNEATAAVIEAMPADGNYADWNDVAIKAIQAAWKNISDAVKDVQADLTKAKDKETDVLALIATNKNDIVATSTNYVTKYNTCEANKTAADAAVKTLVDNLTAASANEDVKKDLAAAISSIQTKIDNLKKNVAADYAAPHAIETADYTSVVNGIQADITALEGNAAPVIENYNIYKELVANLGSDAGLQKALNDAKTAVGNLAPADEADTYDAAAKFKATADALQKTIDNIAKDAKAAYNNRTLSAATRTALDTRISDAGTAITQYQTDATDAMARFDVVSAAVKDYNAKLATLTATVGANTAVQVRTATTTVTGVTYGDRITKLQTKKTAIENAFKNANDKLDLEHLTALLNISLDPTISTDADALNTAFSVDKKTSEDLTKQEAAQILYNAADDVIKSIENRITAHEADWQAGNEDGKLGLKYDDLTARLATIKTAVQAKDADIRAVCPSASAITPEIAAEAMALLSEIKADVDEINKDLTTLEGDVDTQIAFVKAENKAKKDVEKNVQNITKILDKAIQEFQVDKLGTETIQPQADAIQAKLDVVKTDVANARAEEKAQAARKDSKDAEGATVKGLDTRVNEIKAEAEALKQLAIDSTANYNSYKDLMVVYNGQKMKYQNADYVGYANIFAKVGAELPALTNGTNLAYYKSLIADPTGKYFKESASLLQAIEKAYTDGDVAEKTAEITSKLKTLTTNIVNILEDAENDKWAYDGRVVDATNTKNSQVKEGEDLMKYWNDINNKFNASDIAPETLKPMLDELAVINSAIKAEQELVDKMYAEGKSYKSDDEIMNKYSSLRAELKVKEDFINGNEDYNNVIASDNLNRYNAFLAVVQITDKANADAKDLVKKYQNISTEELKALVNIDVIIAAQENIYKYSALIENLKNEAKSTFDGTVSPALWDVKGTYAETAENYTTELNDAKQALDDAVNNQVRIILDSKIATLQTQLSDAETAIGSYDKNVKKNALKDVKDFYNKVKANSYKYDPYLINNLDADWNTFNEIPDMLGADLEKAAQAEWDAMYNGKYVGTAGSLTEDDDRYAGAKADNEKWLEEMGGFAYADAAADVDAYKNIVKNTLDKAIAKANAAIAANNLYDNIAAVKTLIDNFYSQARAQYDAAKAKAQAFEANQKAFAQLTDDYKLISEKVVAAAQYYINFNIFDRALDGYFDASGNYVKGSIDNAIDKVMAWQEQLTKENASAELADRINGNTLAEGESWYDYDAITGTINSIYATSNADEVNALRAEIAAINTEKQDAIDKFYGKDTEKINEIEKYYKDNCKNLLNELNALTQSFIDNGTKEEAKQDAGLLTLEKKIAAAHAGLTKIWKYDLVADATATLQQLIADAQEDFDAAQADFDDAHKPVQKKHAHNYEIFKNRFATAKALFEASGDEILTYDDKIIAVVEKVVKRMNNEREELNNDDMPFDVHETVYARLLQANNEAKAEVERVYGAVNKLHHASMDCGYDVDGSGSTDPYSMFYDFAYFDDLNGRISDNAEALADANEALETGENLLDNSSSLVWSAAGIKNRAAYIERLAAYNETVVYYADMVSKAYNSMNRAAEYGLHFRSSLNYKADSSKSIYDPDGTIEQAYNDYSTAVNALHSYANQFNNINEAVTNTQFDINGDAWGYDEDGNPVVKPINYVKDAEGAALVYATAEELAGKIAELETKIAESVFKKGDVNRDGEVLSDDFLAVIGGVLNPATLDEMRFAAADVNSDTRISIADVTLLATKVTTGKWADGTISNRYAPMATAETISVSAQDNNGVQRIAINLNNHRNYVGCQMDIVLPAGMTLVGESVGDRANGHSLYSNDLGNVHRIVVSTIENNNFNQGNAIVYLDVEGGSVENISLENVIFADAYGRAANISSDTNGINGVEAESSLKQKIYSVGGQLMNKVKQGINIIRNANGSTKKVTGNNK